MTTPQIKVHYPIVTITRPLSLCIAGNKMLRNFYVPTKQNTADDPSRLAEGFVIAGADAISALPLFSRSQSSLWHAHRHAVVAQ